jgi:1,5-anhydro-D-fructose reductase (1,5-anhydro-D-mannitol-forming)
MALNIRQAGMPQSRHDRIKPVRLIGLALETGFFILELFDSKMKIQGTVSWGIIGCGDVCEVKSGPAFNKVENSKLVAVMRRDTVKAKDYAQRHGVPKFYDDAAALINDPEVNAIYIATPPSTHEPYLAQALKAGKPVYVEKPVSVDLASCQRMVSTAHQLSGMVSVAHYRRGLTLFNIVKALVQEGHIGNVRLVQLRTLQPQSAKYNHKADDNWRIVPALSGGGIFHDLSPHQLDIMYWIFGKPKTFHGFSVNQSKSYDAPDVTMLHATYQNDVCLSACALAERGRSTWLPKRRKRNARSLATTENLSFHFSSLGHLRSPHPQARKSFPWIIPSMFNNP